MIIYRSLSDPEQRTALKAVRFEEANSDPVYAHLRKASREFGRGISNLFFEDHPELRTLIREYGVF